MLILKLEFDEQMLSSRTFILLINHLELLGGTPRLP